MASKKMPPADAVSNKTTVIKIAEKVGELAGRIVNKKDQLVNLAGEALSSVTGVVGSIANGRKTLVKTAAAPAKVSAKPTRNATKKTASTPSGSSAPVKRTVSAKKSAVKTAATKAPAVKRSSTPKAAKKTTVNKTAANGAPSTSKRKLPVAGPAASKKSSKK